MVKRVTGRFAVVCSVKTTNYVRFSDRNRLRALAHSLLLLLAKAVADSNAYSDELRRVITKCESPKSSLYATASGDDDDVSKLLSSLPWYWCDWRCVY